MDITMSYWYNYNTNPTQIHYTGTDMSPFERNFRLWAEQEFLILLTSGAVNNQNYVKRDISVLVIVGHLPLYCGNGNMETPRIQHEDRLSI